MIEELNKENFDEKTKQGNSMVDFFADWCGPCQMMEPIFEKISKEPSDVNFFRVDVDNNKEIAGIYAVRSIPTLVFIKDGKEVDRHLGLLNEDALKEKIKEVFK